MVMTPRRRSRNALMGPRALGSGIQKLKPPSDSTTGVFTWSGKAAQCRFLELALGLKV